MGSLDPTHPSAFAGLHHWSSGQVSPEVSAPTAALSALSPASAAQKPHSQAFTAKMECVCRSRPEEEEVVGGMRGREVTAWGPRLPPSLVQLPLPRVGPFAPHRWAGSWFLCWDGPSVPVLLTQLLGGTEDWNTNHLQNFRAGTGRKPQRAFR